MFVGLLNVCTIGMFGRSLVSNSKGSIKCISLNNNPCKARTSLVNLNSNEIIFYPFIVSINKCSGYCNITNDSYARVCEPDNAKNIIVERRNLI